MATEIAEGIPYECEICGTTENLKCMPIMTGDRFGQPCKHPVCGECISMWYESGETDGEKLKELVLAERAAKRFRKVVEEAQEVVTPTNGAK